MELVDKAALVAEIERRINVYQKNFDKADNKIARLSTYGRIAGLKDLLDFINTVEVKEVDLEKEIQDHLRECLNIKFPTTNVTLIASDVEYTARKFFELGVKVNHKGE